MFGTIYTTFDGTNYTRRQLPPWMHNFMSVLCSVIIIVLVMMTMALLATEPTESHPPFIIEYNGKKYVQIEYESKHIAVPLQDWKENDE